MLTAALSNTSCCSSRKAVSESRTETAAQVETTVRSARRAAQQQGATVTTETERLWATETEVEIYDTTQPADPTTGAHPVEARIRQTHGEGSRSRAQLEETASGRTETTDEASQTYEGCTLDEVTAERAPSLWERIKRGAAWAAAIMIPAAAGWIIFKNRKLKKR